MVSLADFCGLMEEAMVRHPMPRAYLLPSQSARSGGEQPTFKPALCNKSKVRFEPCTLPHVQQEQDARCALRPSARHVQQEHAVP